MKRNPSHSRPAPSVMVFYDHLTPPGELEDHGKNDIRAWLGTGDDRIPLGTFPDRKAAMRAVSNAAKAAAEMDGGAA
jgi:hypothetical protein